MNPAYRNVRFRVETPAPGLPVAFGIVTACNPDGRTVSDEENQQATGALLRALQSETHVPFPVTGGSPDFSHSEPGFGVRFASPEETVSWGRRFRQEAVFWVEDGKVRLIACDGTDSAEIGDWQALVLR